MGLGTDGGDKCFCSLNSTPSYDTDITQNCSSF